MKWESRPKSPTASSRLKESDFLSPGGLCYRMRTGMCRMHWSFSMFTLSLILYLEEAKAKGRAPAALTDEVK